MNLNYQKQVKRQQKSQMRFFIFMFVFCILLGGILFSPVFSAKNIEITKLKKYTDSEILDKIKLNINTNIFSFKKRAAEKILKSDIYIEDAEISIKLPNTISINIKERLVRGYVPHAGSYLYIDEYGRVLDVQNGFTDHLPVVVGLEFDGGFKLGEILKVSNEESFDVVVLIAQLMTKYDLLDTVVKVDVSDPKNIVAYVNKIDIKLGNINDCDKKIRTMAAIIKEIPENDRGTLDLSDISKPWIFRYLT